MMRLPLVAKRFAALTKRLPSVANWFGCASLIGSLWSLMMLPANPQRGAAEPISERSEPLSEAQPNQLASAASLLPSAASLLPSAASLLIYEVNNFPLCTKYQK
jgi:predicted acyltransferase